MSDFLANECKPLFTACFIIRSWCMDKLSVQVKALDENHMDNMNISFAVKRFCS